MPDEIVALDPAPRPGPGLPDGAKAWLLLDVDGVLNVETTNSKAKALGLKRVRGGGRLYGSRVTAYVPSWVGAALAELDGFAIGWATSWMDEVDHGWPTGVSWAAGLPTGLPYADFRYRLKLLRQGADASKLDGIEAFVGSDPFVWIDDERFPGDRERMTALPQPTLFLESNPYVGITREHIARAAEWVTRF